MSVNHSSMEKSSTTLCYENTAFRNEFSICKLTDRDSLMKELCRTFISLFDPKNCQLSRSLASDELMFNYWMQAILNFYLYI